MNRLGGKPWILHTHIAGVFELVSYKTWCHQDQHISHSTDFFWVRASHFFTTQCQVPESQALQWRLHQDSDFTIATKSSLRSAGASRKNFSQGKIGRPQTSSSWDLWPPTVLQGISHQLSHLHCSERGRI